MDEQPAPIGVHHYNHQVGDDNLLRRAWYYSSAACLMWLLNSLIFLYGPTSTWRYFVGGALGIVVWYTFHCIMSKCHISRQDILRRENYESIVHITLLFLVAVFEAPLVFQALRIDYNSAYPASPA